MGWYRQLHLLCGGALLHPDVAAALPHDDPSVALKRAYHLEIAKARDLGQTTSSRISAPGSATMSSSTGSR